MRLACRCIQYKSIQGIIRKIPSHKEYTFIRTCIYMEFFCSKFKRAIKYYIRSHLFNLVNIFPSPQVKLNTKSISGPYSLEFFYNVYNKNEYVIS